jgi:signal transduction histidine kinase
LAASGVPNGDTMANMLVNMGVHRDLPAFLSLLQGDDNMLIVQTAYNLFMQQSNSQNIKMAVERVSKVVFALKNYAHYDSTGQKIRADIIEGIEVVLTLYHNQLKRGIEVMTQYDEIPQIFCYPDELNQVWTNLIHNAIQAMEGKGSLGIRARRHHQELVVQITDSGCGIPEEIQPRIFEPFFTTKPAGEGSGLGLDIVRKILDRHNGKITCDSQPGKTTFSVFLPIET